MPRLPLDTPILVVDDSKAIRALMEAFLGRLGYRNTRFAGGVKDGLSKFEEQHSEVVFLDVLLDQEEGGEFARFALDDRPFTTLVLMTALSADDEEVVRLVAHGARHLLPKPLRLSSVRQVLEKIQESRDEEAEGFAPPPTPKPDASYG